MVECELDEPREGAAVGEELALRGRLIARESPPRGLWLRRDRIAARRLPLDSNGGFAARVPLGRTARGPLAFELWAALADGSERRVCARRVFVDRAAPPRLTARDAAIFVGTAAGKAWRAIGEGRLPASPSKWLRDLRLHFDELLESRAAEPSRPRAALARAAAAELAEFLRGSERLDFTPRAAPAASVVIVTFGRAELTLRCLRSLAAACARSPFELVLVDNASADATAALLDRLGGATILRNATNEGFLRAVNRAARAARGRHLALVNNDAELHPGALDFAVARLDATPDAGAVGGKLIAPDGRLQEAGSIILSDGSCAGCGRGAAPDDSAYEFVRDVDFSSGALLVTPRALFSELGGFDERYAPAYYEDADYCARLWRSGRRVIYDPRVAAQHYEFASSPSRAAALAMQAERRPIFFAAHADWLATQPRPGTPERRARRRPARGRRVLFVDDRAPDPASGSGHPRARAMVDALIARGHQVAVLPTRRAPVGARAAPLPEVVELVAGAAADALAARAYDCVLVSRPHNLRLVLDAAPAAPVIYDAEALYAARDAHARRLAGERVSDAEIARLVDEELRLASRARAVLAVSAGEAARFSAAGAARVSIVGHALAPAPGAAPFAARDGFLFVGAFHHDASPNSDSMFWFAREIWPLIRARLPGALFTIAGARPTAAIAALAGADVDVLGRVDDLAPLYDQARVFVAPTRFGAGLPYKLHHAAAHGLPAVATPLVAGQLGWRDELVVAADAAAFAAACVELHGDEAAWQKLRARALDRVARDCEPGAFTDALDRIVREA